MPVAATVSCAWGLSPRGRGNRRAYLRAVYHRGSIPAWAGKPRPSRPLPVRTRVYPRVGGETYRPSSAGVTIKGLSPRGRGNPCHRHDRSAQPGSIPAWAGKPRPSTCPTAVREVYPRVGGETPARARWLDLALGLSPRGRGNQQQQQARQQRHGSIPAWAGKPWQAWRVRRRARVYPRVGGETEIESFLSCQSLGLSPRGRGNPGAERPAGRHDGSIPAWAGKP